MNNNLQKTIEIKAPIKTTLEGMDRVVSKIKEGLNEGTTKIDMTKGIGN
jgi:hypothetical protein